MRNFLFISILLFFCKSYSQNQVEGLVLDQDTKNPIEYADIFNNQDFTSSNADGKFIFKSKQDSIYIHILGYDAFATTFQELKSDTIYLKSRFEVLDEVILSQANLLNPILKSIHENYPFEPFTESFFLRSVIRKDGEILKLQDLSGLISRKTLLSTSTNPMPNKNYEVGVESMRKAGVKEDEIYFELYSFEQFLTAIMAIAISQKQFDFVETKSEKDNLVKYEFSPNKLNASTTSGYYLVNTSDNSFNEFYSLNIDNQASFRETRGVKDRTTHYELLVSFKKDVDLGKYFINKAKLKAKVEVIEKDKTPVFYDAEYLWLASPTTTQKIYKKVSLSRDLFKLKATYDKEFWEDQNNLLLTDEMQGFLKGLNDPNSEF